MAAPELRHPYPSPTWLRARLAVLGVTSGTAFTLLLLGCSPDAAVTAAAAAAAGGAEIGCGLTGPFPAPWTRVTVLVVILLLVVIMVGSGQQPALSVTVILAAAGASVEAARRVAGKRSPVPGLSS
jgi:hypothetical protein